MMLKTLLTPAEVDRIFRYPVGRSERLARRGRLPHIKLPCGQIRFDEAEINLLLGNQNASIAPNEVAHA